jgi:hypothetical protein
VREAHEPNRLGVQGRAGEFFGQCGAFVVKVWLKIAILRLNKIEIGELLLNLQRYVSKKVGPTIHM